MTKFERVFLFIVISVLAITVMILADHNIKQSEEIVSLKQNYKTLRTSVQHLLEIKIAELKRKAVFREQLNKLNIH